MTRSMLIDAAHPEETRIAVVNERRLEDFDYEAAARTTLKGNIYLGKIARVEASLQAAFVEYGGNRHGFLPFADIHPDYYRLPQEDRQALIEEEAAARRDRDLEGGDEEEDADEAEANGRDEAQDDRRRANRLRRQYKIQEVIKRRQIVLVQVSKEERGTKGAALTTYLSLAGRYCVLMPNTGHGGGISRKITNATDRRKLKGIVESLEVPDGTAVIMRTAGVKRTKTEIKRDYDFLTRTWERIREDTLSSTAPALIYEEADLVKRAIRDIYGRDIEEVLVEGDRAYRNAKDFMKALMPSHAKRVQQYKEQSEPLFIAHGIEDQLYDLHTARVELPSGGYLVIDSTEALVAIDVNSGRSTRERNIEETAVKTNLEAADEVARQLRLRDLAGIIVIDFIDMDDRRNNSQVERRLKDALGNDRARVQVGRISALGLLEMSRQRLRPSIQESSTVACPHCNGNGFVRSVESSALQTARAIEQEALGGGHGVLSVYVPTDTALYLLNHKRDLLNRLASEHGVEVLLERDDTQPAGSWRFESLAPKPREDASEAEPAAAEAAEETPEVEAEDEDGGAKRRRRSRRGGRRRKADASDETETVEAAPASDAGEPEPAAAPAAEAEAPKPARRRRRAAAPAVPEPEVPEPEVPEPEAPPAADVDSGEAVEEAPKPRRRRTRRKKEETASEPAAGPAAEQADASPSAEADAVEAPEEAPKPRRRRTRRRKEEAPEAAAPEEQPQETPVQEAPAETEAAPVASEEPPAQEAPAQEAPAETEAAPAAAEEPPQEPPAQEAPAQEAPAEPDTAPAGEAEPGRRRGWWRRQLNLV